MPDIDSIAVMHGVTEYCENLNVELDRAENGALCVTAYNEAGYDCTQVDLSELLDWVSKSPETRELWKACVRRSKTTNYP